MNYRKLLIIGLLTTITLVSSGQVKSAIVTITFPDGNDFNLADKPVIKDLLKSRTSDCSSILVYSKKNGGSRGWQPVPVYDAVDGGGWNFEYSDDNKLIITATKWQNSSFDIKVVLINIPKADCNITLYKGKKKG